VIIGAVVGVLLLAGVAIVISVVCYKRRQALSPYQDISDQPEAEYNFMVTDSVADLSTPTMLRDLPSEASVSHTSLSKSFII
jgi:hypothetical protein